MARLRDSGPYIWTTWLNRLLVGDSSCEWATWFKAQHEGASWEKVPDDTDWVSWRTKHTSMMTDARQRLEDDGYRVFTESQNKFTIKSRSSGITLAGIPDLVARRGDEGIIIEVKSTQPRDSHRVQLMTYMYAVPRALDQHRGIAFDGKLIYANQETPVPVESVDEAFVESLGRLITRVGAQTPARKVPSPDECRFCNITKNDCPERDADGPIAAGVTDDF